MHLSNNHPTSISPSAGKMPALFPIHPNRTHTQRSMRSAAFWRNVTLVLAYLASSTGSSGRDRCGDVRVRIYSPMCAEGLGQPTSVVSGPGRVVQRLRFQAHAWIEKDTCRLRGGGGDSAVSSSSEE